MKSCYKSCVVDLVADPYYGPLAANTTTKHGCRSLDADPTMKLGYGSLAMDPCYRFAAGYKSLLLQKKDLL